MRGLLLLSSLILLLLNFINKDIIEVDKYNFIEKYNPALSNLNSVDKLIFYTDSTAKASNISQNSIEYWILLKNIVSNRFYHGFSHYKLNENWIAVLSDKILGHGLANKVIPDDIMKNPMAGCSQQVAIIMDVASKKNILYRSIGFPHHYAVELNYNNNWYFFDPDMEPNLSITDRLHQNWNGNNDNLKKYYYGEHKSVDFELGKNEKAILGVPNAKQAPRLKIFQAITLFLSRLLWIVPLILYFALGKRNKKSSANTKLTAIPHLLPA